MADPQDTPLVRELDQCIAKGEILLETVREAIATLSDGPRASITDIYQAAARIPWGKIYDSYKTWDEYNHTVLRQSFIPPAAAQQKVLEYTWAGDRSGLTSDQVAVSKKLSSLRALVADSLRWLRSLRATAHLYPLEHHDAHRPDPQGSRIMIGHGRSQLWQELKSFLEQDLSLEVDEYNRIATAGLSRKERLHQMLEECCFAFLVLTAEDQRADGVMQARQNVIHELGLAQGKYGFERAIVLLEQGCEEFSNIAGLDQIRFPAGDIAARFDEVLRILEREAVVAPRIVDANRPPRPARQGPAERPSDI